MRAVSLLFHDVFAASPDESGFRSAAANRYKLSAAELDAQLDGIASCRSDAPASLEIRLESGASEDLPWRVTFDDGGRSYHALVADRLEARGWRGLCFVATDMIGRPGFLDAAQIRDLDARGHVIGSHSASHPARLSSRTPAEIRVEWVRSRAVLEDLLGRPITAASVPGGYFSPAVASAADQAGIRVLFTSEPTTRTGRAGMCTVVGRFTIRRGADADLSRRLVRPLSLTRAVAWAGWNAKGLIKPVLGPHYARLADWVLADGTRSASPESL